VVLVILILVIVSVIAYFQVGPASQTRTLSITVTNRVVEENVFALRDCTMNYFASTTTYVMSPSGPTRAVFFTTTQYSNYTITAALVSLYNVTTVVSGTTVTQVCG